MAEHEEGKPLENYSVGYGKPPVGSRFKKGQSGNPTGRPKGTLNFSTALLKALSEKISVTENGRPKRISKLDAMLKQIINKAVNGNLQAASKVTSLATAIEQKAEEAAPRRAELNELDKKTVLDLIKRFEDSNEE